MKMIRTLLEGARALGACRKTDGVHSLDTLLDLYRSPQGQEFCTRHAYPTREQWTAIARHWNAGELYARNVHIDREGDPLTAHNPGFLLLVGASTSACVTISGPAVKHTVVALHGATVTVSASDHAVFEVYGDESARITVRKDHSSIRL